MRDYLQEAKYIIEGKTMMLPEKAHLEAMNNVIFKLIEEINKVLTLLEEIHLFNEELKNVIR